MPEMRTVPIRDLSELQAGDRVLDPLSARDSKSILVEREIPDLVLPTTPLVTIRGTWRNTGGVADFEAILRGGKGGPLAWGEPRWIILDDGSAYTAEALARSIDVFEIIGGPAGEDWQ